MLATKEPASVEKENVGLWPGVSNRKEKYFSLVKLLHRLLVKV